MPISHFVPGPDDATPVDIDNNLNIKYVGTGGNAGSGAYLYWYQNNSVLAPSGGNMTINLLDALSPGSPNTRYFVYSYTSTSKRIKANKPPVSKTSTAIQFTMALDEHELAFLAVVVWDKETNAIFSCDPQVGNDPETAP